MATKLKPQPTIRRTTRIKLATASIVLILSSCHFKFPTVSEQEELLKRGSFPNGAPPWMAPRTRGASLGGRISGGIIPEHFGATPPAATISAEQTIPPTAVDPLKSVADLCPNLERQLNDALTTVDNELQIEKYQALTKRCPRSAALMLFLCEAYQRAKIPAAMKRCLERVLILDPGNQQAARINGEVNRSRQ